MGAEQHVTLQSRYNFEHGADFEVKYLGSGDETGRVKKDRFAVTGGGYKVYFEMMKLLPRTVWEENNPRQWGFGDITDAVSGRRVWDFQAFARPLEFRGDMTTVCGDDNRTYVECRNKAGELKHRFLLAKLLPQWQKVVSIPVPPLQKQAAAVDFGPLDSPIAVTVNQVLSEAPAVSGQFELEVATVPHAHTVSVRNHVAADLAKIAHPSLEMRYFVREVLSRMVRAPTPSSNI